MLNIQKSIKIIFFTVLGLVVVSLLISIQLPISQSFRTVFGSFLVIFLPGFTLSFVFFPSQEKHKSIDSITRITLAIALSIAVVPLILFYLNKAGMPINLLNSSLVILAIVVIGSVIIYFKQKKQISTN
ncbi:MAG: DUF1616 domain-containing protein [Patescibacteria group bacterium]